MTDLGSELQFHFIGAGKSPNFAKRVSTAWLDRKFVVLFINAYMCLWYMRVFWTGESYDLQNRLIFLWLPLSTMNLYAEHNSNEGKFDSNRFLEHAMLNSFHYLAGYAMFLLPLWICIPLVGVALCGYGVLCYMRYYLSETKLHKHSVIFEIIISLFILPVFLVADLLMRNPPQKQFFWPYVVIDMVLKIARTTFLYKFKDAFHDDPSFYRQQSWETPVGSNSILTLMQSWEGSDWINEHPCLYLFSIHFLSSIIISSYFFSHFKFEGDFDRTLHHEVFHRFVHSSILIIYWVNHFPVCLFFENLHVFKGFCFTLSSMRFFSQLFLTIEPLFFPYEDRHCIFPFYLQSKIFPLSFVAHAFSSLQKFFFWVTNVHKIIL